MSTKKRTGATQHLISRACQRSRAATKELMAWLMRVLLVVQRPARLAKAGFVLPTVVLVSLVVTLLTTAILARSFDRAQSASNYRVSEGALNAALPALDRAKAKIDALFQDPNLPRGTPTEVAINDVLIQDKYTIGDEARLKLGYDFGNGTGNFGDDNIIQEFGAGSANSFENGESLTTAWRFPVDTDNNGKFDSFSLYSILFRSPNISPTGDFTRQRTPLDARALPLDKGEVSGACEAAVGNSSSLVGTSGWISAGGQLKKSFFVYVATVPITDVNELDLPPEYEPYPGSSQGFSSLEYQQDNSRIPLSNNAVIYEDDLGFTPGPTFRLNGRVVTNSNLFLKTFGNGARFYQVSSKESCFYDPENAKIVVGGNVVYGSVDGVGNGNAFDVDLFDGQGNDPKLGETLDTNNPSVNEPTSEVLYNTQAYEQRINELVALAIAENGITTDTGTPPNRVFTSNDPQVVVDGVNALINGPNPIEPDDARERELDSYFRQRTRRVPFAEVPVGGPIGTADIEGEQTELLRPSDEWIYPFDPADGKDGTGFSGLSLKTNNDKLLPQATKFDFQLVDDQGKETFIGDRTLIGNNLPALRLEGNQFLGEELSQDIDDTEWDRPEEEDVPRERKTRVRPLDDLGDIGRDGFWETKAAEFPANELDNSGGLRIVTDAGIYLPAGNVISPSPNVSNVIWPDTMPVIPDAEKSASPPTHSLTNPTVPPWFTDYPTDDVSGTAARPFLRMRATAVYHYRHTDDSNGDSLADPIACVDTYYDPTNTLTANRPANGIVYGPPTENVANSTIRDYLDYQASLLYPNGRKVNELLNTALSNLSSRDLTLAEQSAIDSAICSLQIYGKVSGDTTTWGDIGDPTETPVNGYTLRNYSIKEISFLDSRQIKAIESPTVDDSVTAFYDDRYFDVPSDSLTNPPTTPITAGLYNAIKSLNGLYQLPIEQRQPLEIRVTQINIDNLRRNRADTTNTTATDEYMLPNSGIIYATRNDALPDDTEPDEARLSANDYALDPTRRANGVMLINGNRLARTVSVTGNSNDFRAVEKGLTLVSNLPVYVKGEFNPHEDAGGNAQEEFAFGDELDPDYGNFYDRQAVNANNNFACRKGDPRLPSTSCLTPDEWRTGNILSDAVTLLSDGFAEGTRVDGDFDLRNNQTDNLGDPNGGGSDEISKSSEVIEDRLRRGFWNNNYVTSRGFIDTRYSDGLSPDYTDDDDSSYFNNFVTPIQRRVRFPEYIMEICQKLPVSKCEPDDWVVGFDGNGDGDLDDTLPSGLLERDVKAYQLGSELNALGIPGIIDPAGIVDWTTQFLTGVNRKSVLERLGAGTTARPALMHEEDTIQNGTFDSLDPTEDLNLNGVFDDDWRYPRRVAFARNTSNQLETTTIGSNTTYKPMGVGCPLDIAVDNDPSTIETHGCEYGGSVSGVNYGIPDDNALWFRTTNNTSGPPNLDPVYQPNRPLFYEEPVGGDLTNQPLLVPVLQLQYPALPTSIAVLPASESQTEVESTNWIQQPSGDTIFNMVMATGDVPNRPPFGTSVSAPGLIFNNQHKGDFNGGLPNLPRFLENWDKAGAGATAEIRGSLIQLKRSEFATAPFFQLGELREAGQYTPGGPFGYPQIYTQGEGSGRSPFFTPPNRDWGFDVGLLSQLPDLLAQQFQLRPASAPNQFFREVDRSDDWIQTLLCAKDLNPSPGAVNDNAINSDQRPTAFCLDKSLP